MEKPNKDRITLENQKWEARAIISDATGHAAALLDEINDLVDPVQRVNSYQDATNDQRTAVADKVISRQKTFVALINAVLNDLDEADKQLN